MLSSPMPELFVWSTISTFVFYLEAGLESPGKKNGNQWKSFSKTSFQLSMALKKGQKQGRYERPQEDYATPAVYFCRCQVVFLHSFISALFLILLQTMLLQTMTICFSDALLIFFFNLPHILEVLGWTCSRIVHNNNWWVVGEHNLWTCRVF